MLVFQLGDKAASRCSRRRFNAVVNETSGQPPAVFVDTSLDIRHEPAGHFHKGLMRHHQVFEAKPFKVPLKISKSAA